ncbi:HAD family hydrolase [Algoriphagus sp. PAP.12]|uniref:HAD family hydrolase n=1 Tax=Algoriphagus sp. PAP.12 TaxID=2996678 RepID=UPI00227D6904|nr:HAD family phosphatase [Algoriphagus sp. PAP.12]
MIVNNNPIQGVIFDMDGTLVDSIPYHLQSWIIFLEKNGITIREEDFHAQNHGTLQEMIMRFFPNEKSADRIYELGEEKEETFRELYRPHMKEVPGVTPFLKTLSNQNKSIHLATMGEQDNIDYTIDHIDIRSFFQSLTGGHEVKNGKPDPEIFLKALDKAQIQAENAIVFEDSSGGIRAALGAGIPVFGIATTHTPQELENMGCQKAFLNFDEALNYFY